MTGRSAEKNVDGVGQQLSALWQGSGITSGSRMGSANGG